MTHFCFEKWDRGSVTLRRRLLNDLPRLVRILRNSFPGWLRRVPYLTCPTVVAEIDGVTCGFVSVKLHGREGEVAIIAVGEPYRHSGIGLALLNAGESMLRTRHAACFRALVRIDNPAGNKLFETAGFHSIGLKRRRILGDVEVMLKDLSGLPEGPQL